jgi:hypothetical protein
MTYGIKLIGILMLAALFGSCNSLMHTNKALSESKSKTTKMTSSAPKDDSQLTKLKKAEKEADEPGRAVLKMGRKMALEEKVIIKGSCWNWVNECFKRAGYGTEKYIAYKSKKSGPYVDIDKIKPGDWIYYINYSYNKVEHSGIFVYWVDKKKKIGVTLSYGGEHRKEPGRYREYLLKDVYYITRAGRSR